MPREAGEAAEQVVDDDDDADALDDCERADSHVCWVKRSDVIVVVCLLLKLRGTVIGVRLES